MKFNIHTNDELLEVRDILQADIIPESLTLNIIAHQFFWNIFDIGDFINILNLAKQKNIKIYLKGNFEAADKARLAPYYSEFEKNIKHNKSESYNIIISDYIIDAEVGIYKHEYNKKQQLKFNLSVELLKSYHASKIEDVFSYDIILDIIYSLVKNKHIELLESLAEDICSLLLKNKLVQKVNIRIEKLNLINGSVGIKLNRNR